MKTIAIIHRGGAYAPCVELYRAFLEKNGYHAKVLKNPGREELATADVEWHSLGFDLYGHHSNRLKIHEYTSLSIPPFARQKNQLKKWLNRKPDLRIFGNAFICQEFGFSDGTPHLFMDAGVEDFFFFEHPNPAPVFDFVYVGSTDKTRKINLLIEAFFRQLPQSNLLVIGVPPANLPVRFLKHTGLVFTGKLPYEQVPAHLRQARFGINYVPDVYPYRHQWSVKMLEYCAVGLPVITLDYDWVNQFERERNARFFKLKPDMSNLRLELIEAFNFVTPDVRDLQWEHIMMKSGILQFLSKNI